MRARVRARARARSRGLPATEIPEYFPKAASTY